MILPRIIKTAEQRSESSESLGYPPADHPFWFMDAGELQSAAGQVVNATTAQKISAVYACIQAISESVAMLPVSIFEDEDERTKRKVSEHPIAKLLRVAPNDFQDSFEFFELLQASILESGNAYAFKEQSKVRVKALVPLRSDEVRLERNKQGDLEYHYRPKAGKHEKYRPDEMFHIRHRSKDGLLGRSPIGVCADTIGFALGLQKHGNKVFENGAFLSGFIKSPFKFKDDEQRRQFMSSFKKVLSVNNSGKFGLLEQGTDYAPYSMNFRDAQFIESKRFSVLEIARIFRMPPHMIQDLSEGASYSSIEHQSINFVTYTIQPWVTRWEYAIKRQLLGVTSPEYIKFNVSALMRSDLKSKTEAIVQQLQYGLKTINEARHLMDDNPIDSAHGDDTFVSHNMIPIDVQVSTGGQKESGSGFSPSNEEPKEEQLINSEPLLVDLISRSSRREIQHVKREKDREDFEDWLADWMVEHRKLMQEALSPACRVIRKEHQELLSDFLDRYVHERTREYLTIGVEAAIERLKREPGQMGVELNKILHEVENE